VVRRAQSDAPYPGCSSLTNGLYRPTSFGTVAFARLVNAATAVFAAESLSRNSPISNPRFLPRKRMALNFRFSRPRNAIFGINVAAFKGPISRDHVIALATRFYASAARFSNICISPEKLVPESQPNDQLSVKSL
jgi:hypothetical protein